MDYYDYGASPSFWWLFSNVYLYVFLIYGSFFLYLFPLAQAIVQYQNNKWLRSTLGRVKDLDSETRSKILAEASPEFKEPLYKLTKLQYLVSGIITTIIGLLIIILQEPEPDIIDYLIWLPLLIGAGVTAIYYKVFPHVRLWKETAGFFAVLGICITIPGIFAVYEWDWMRSDLLIYLVLVMCLAIVHLLESTISSLMYMTAVAVGSIFLTENVSNNWMFFFKSFIWFFTLAPLVFWMPKLKSSKEMGIKEIAFGILFLIMMITVTFTNLGHLRFLGLAIILPVLYMFSKIHFKQDGWFMTKPIQTIIIILTFYGIAGFSDEQILGELPTFSYQFFDHFSFSWLVDLIVIIVMVFGGIMMFRDNFEEDLKKISLVVLAFPPVAYILSFTADYYGNVLFIPIMAIYGWSYLRTGLEAKNVIAIIFGGAGVLTTLALVYAQLPPETFIERFNVGALVTLYGLAMIGMAFYLRSQWQVTNDEEITTNPLPKSSDLLDNDTEV